MTYTTRTFQLHTDQISAMRTNLNHALEAVEADASLSPVGKQQRIAALWKSTSAAVKQKITEFDRDVEARRTQLTATVFGPSGDISAMDFRDALDRAERCADASEARRLYDRATRTSDKALTKALATIGHEKGWSDIVSTYLESDQSSGDAARELNVIENGEQDIAMGFTRAVATSPPRQLSNLSPTQIDALVSS